MPFIAIGKAVDEYQAVLEPDHELVRFVCSMVDPVNGVVHQLLKFSCDPGPFYPNVLVRLSEVSRPAPYLPEHSPMYFLAKCSGK